MIDRRLDKRSKEEKFRDDSEFFRRIERYLNKKKGNEYELGSTLDEMNIGSEPPRNTDTNSLPFFSITGSSLYRGSKKPSILDKGWKPSLEN